jgi:hypothetical protein
MPLQPGEVLVGSWEPYAVIPFRANYEDNKAYRSVSGNYSVITDLITPREFPVFVGELFAVPNPFDGQYDRFDYEEIQYQRSIDYSYIVTYADGTTQYGGITANSYSYAPNDTPTPMPRPTLSGIADLPPTLNRQDLDGNPVPIASINWVPSSTNVVLRRFNSPLFFPGWTAGRARNIYVRSAFWVDPSELFDDYPSSSDGILLTPTKINFYRRANKPTYYDLLRGYPLDLRTIPDAPIITISENKKIEIGYYRENKLEPIPELRSIDWLTYQCDILANTPYTLPIVDCVLGTLEVSDPIVINSIDSLPTSAQKYPTRYYFRNNLPNLFAGWYALWNPTNATPALDANGNGVLETRILRKLGANNDRWNNRSNETPDLNFEPNHPMFLVDDTRAYNWHLAPQTQGIGTLVMDSIRTIESHEFLQQLIKALQAQNYQVEDLTADPPVHYLDWYIKNGNGGDKIDKIYKALGAEIWGINPDSTDVARVDNLGWRLRRLCEVLGIRVKPDGTIDEALEKTTNRRLHVDGSAENDLQKNNPNCFGSDSMLVRVLPNKFSGNGIVPGGYSKVKDIPQLLAELHEQANAAVGYQQGTAIEINIDGKVYRYPNQLALLTELLITAKQTVTYSKGAFFSSLVGEQSIKEVMGGLGLRTVDKFLEFKVAGKTAKLYYKGISASQSIRRKLSAVATNVGIAIGNII